MTGSAAPQPMSVRVSRSEAERGEQPKIRAEDPVTIVIFGASGDLAKRKLIPALYQLEQNGYMPERYAIIGFARTPMTDEAYREAMRGVLSERAGDGGGVPPDHKLLQSLFYHAGNADEVESFQSLRAKIEK